MVHGGSKQFVGLIVVELEHGFFRLKPIEIVLHVIRGAASECALSFFLSLLCREFVRCGKSPLDSCVQLAEVFQLKVVNYVSTLWLDMKRGRT